MNTGRLLLVQPSADYAGQVRAHFPDAVLLATAERAAELSAHPAVIVADLDAPEAALQAVQRWTRQQAQRLGGIVCFVCQHLPLTAYLAQRLALPFPSPETVARTRHKQLAAAAWQAAGVPTPATQAVDTVEAALDFARRHPAPWILKPTAGTGSEWVLKVHSEQELRAAFGRLAAGLAAPEAIAPQTAPCLIQAFVSGREFGADLYLEDGRLQVLRLTEKYLLQEPGLAGMVGAYFVPRLEAATHSLLATAFLRGCAALGLTRGLAMVDVILSGNTPYLLEMALRPGGDCLPELCRQTLGYDPIYTACRIALGGRPETRSPVASKPIAALHLMSNRSGVVRRLDCTRLLAHPRVVQLLEVYHPPGDELRCWEGCYDDRILAAVLVCYDHPEELPARCISLTELIDLELEDSPYSRQSSLPGGC